MVKIRRDTSFLKKIIIETLISFFVTIEAIDNIFKSNSLFANVYLNLNGPNNIDSELTAQIREFPGQKGTMEFSSKAGELLVSFVKSNNDSNAILSYIAKNKAFQVTSTLIIQSVLFGLFLLGILVVIGVYFSNSITTPILELTKLSSEFSRENLAINLTPKPAMKFPCWVILLII